MRRSGVVRLAVFGLFLMGCYTLQPIRGTAPAPGIEVGLYVNDAGRAALASQMGPEIEQIRGRLLDTSNAEYLVAVSAVETFRRGEQVWNGEQVRIKPEYVLSTSERRFSPGNTIAASVVGVGLGAYFVKNAASGLFFPDKEKPTPTESSATRRIPAGVPLRLPRRW